MVSGTCSSPAAERSATGPCAGLPGVQPAAAGGSIIAAAAAISAPREVRRRSGPWSPKRPALPAAGPVEARPGPRQMHEPMALDAVEPLAPPRLEFAGRVGKRLAVGSFARRDGRSRLDWQ